jgi:hypothetical protein
MDYEPGTDVTKGTEGTEGTETPYDVVVEVVAMCGEVARWPVERDVQRHFGRDADFSPSTLLESTPLHSRERDFNLDCVLETSTLQFLRRRCDGAASLGKRKRVLVSKTKTPARPHQSIEVFRAQCLRYVVDYVKGFHPGSHPVCSSVCFQWALLVIDHVVARAWALLYTDIDCDYEEDSDAAAAVETESWSYMPFLNLLRRHRSPGMLLGVATIWCIHKVHGTAFDLPCKLDCIDNMQTRRLIWLIEAWILDVVVRWNIFAISTPTLHLLDMFEDQSPNVLSAVKTPHVRAVVLRRAVTLCDLYYTCRLWIETKLVEEHSKTANTLGVTLRPSVVQVALAALKASLLDVVMLETVMTADADADPHVLFDNSVVQTVSSLLGVLHREMSPRRTTRRTRSNSAPQLNLDV